MIKVRVLGAKQSAANVRRMDKATRKKFYDTMLELSREILVRSHVYVPYLSGDLLASGKVKGYKGRYPVVYVSYGSAKVPYALMQHENTSFQHPGGKRAKYLELAVDDVRPKIKNALAVAARTETRKYSMAGKNVRV